MSTIFNAFVDQAVREELPTVYNHNVKLAQEIMEFYTAGNEHLQLPFNYSEDKYARRIASGDYFNLTDSIGEAMQKCTPYEFTLVPSSTEENVFHLVYMIPDEDDVHTVEVKIVKEHVTILLRVVPGFADATPNETFMYYKYTVQTKSGKKAADSLHYFVATTKGVVCYHKMHPWTQ